MLFFEIKKQFFGGIHLELSAFSRILMSHFWYHYCKTSAQFFEISFLSIYCLWSLLDRLC
jgi:hypothetical protein